jgi:SpoIIAA-like
MLTQLPRLPRGTVACSDTGKVTAGDCGTVRVPVIEAAVKKRKKIRLLCHLGAHFSGFSAGAIREDARVCFSHIGARRKIAVVTDADWLRS